MSTITDLITGITSRFIGFELRQFKDNLLLAQEQQSDELKLLLGNVITNQNLLRKNIDSINQVEMKVFSQFGEDGILQYLIDLLQIKNNNFVEIGVGNYKESNTRYLLINNNWKGLVIEGNSSWTDEIVRDINYWKYELVVKQSFVTSENVNREVEKAGFSGRIGLLSIDIDGNDYWIWEALQAVEPELVVIEYNSVFGSKRKISVPYFKEFVRTKSHFSNLYFGASLPALIYLAEKKGYLFVGCTSAGNNAFFVKKQYRKKVQHLLNTATYKESKFRESRNRKGELTFISGKQRGEIIAGLPVVNVTNMKTEKL